MQAKDSKRDTDVPSNKEPINVGDFLGFFIKPAPDAKLGKKFPYHHQAEYQ